MLLGQQNVSGSDVCHFPAESFNSEHMLPTASFCHDNLLGDGGSVSNPEWEQSGRETSANGRWAHNTGRTQPPVTQATEMLDYWLEQHNWAHLNNVLDLVALLCGPMHIISPVPPTLIPFPVFLSNHKFHKDMACIHLSVSHGHHGTGIYDSLSGNTCWMNDKKCIWMHPKVNTGMPGCLLILWVNHNYSQLWQVAPV